MSLIKYSIFAFAMLAGTAASAQYTDEINSNRPGESQSAFSVGKSVLQLETGVYGITEKHNLLGTKSNGIGAEFDLRWGLFYEQLELSLNSQYQTDSYTRALGSERRNGFRQMTLGGKYLIYDPFKNYVEKKNVYSWKAAHKFSWRQFLPAVGVYAGVNLNFSNPYTFDSDPNISPKLMLITQNQFNGGYVVVTNIIADKVTSDFPSYGVILTVTKGINEKWSAFVEAQGYKSDYYADTVLRGGAAYLLRENFQIDGSLSFNMKDTPSIFYGGVGISWRFDKNYKPILIRSGKDDKDKDKDKKDKKKKKKRKDEVEAPTGPTTK
ncbi:transporter [Flavobacterium sp. 3HN19-14]|uniref:transporter n=1 Tax=Flavobacterium sp. 3HN19-14 TaxID=3448133 RepID=UPI003EE216D6